MFRKIRPAVSILFALLIVGASTGQAFASVGGRPANPNPNNPRTNNWFIYSLEPGSQTRDLVEVVNNSLEAKKLSVYATDSVVASGGAFSCEQKAEQVDDAGSWITLAKPSVTLAPNASERVGITVTVPSNASVGEHSACIVIQDANQIPAETVQGVRLSTRSAVRVYINIPGDISRQLEIAGFSVFTKPDHKDVRVLQPKIRNTGNVSIDTRLDMRVRNILGMSLYKNGGEYTVMRDEETEWNFELKRPFWGGLYGASFVASYDASPDAVLGVDTDGKKTFLRSRTIWFFSMPTMPGGIAWLLLIILASIAYRMYRKHQQTMTWVRNSWVNHTVAVGEDLTSLGSKHKIDWRIIATANNLQAPFSLKVGQRILVPPPVMTKPSGATKNIIKSATKRPAKKITPTKAAAKPKAKVKAKSKKK